MYYPFITKNGIVIPNIYHYAVVVTDRSLIDDSGIPFSFANPSFDGISSVKLTHNQPKFNVPNRIIINANSYSKILNQQLFNQMTKNYSDSVYSEYRGSLEVLSINKDAPTSSLNMNIIGILKDKYINRYIDLYNRFCKNNIHIILDKSGSLFKLSNGVYTDSNNNVVPRSYIK